MILISAGHNPLAKGAAYNGHNEHDEAVLWAEDVVNAIRPRLSVETVPTGHVSEKIKWINAQPKVHLICEIHFNSDESKRQTGSETLYCPGSLIGRAVAEVVQAALGGVFPPSRGAKDGWYQGDKSKGIVSLLEKTIRPAIIVEPEFIYNWDVLQARRKAACAELAKSLIEAATNITGEA